MSSKWRRGDLGRFECESPKLPRFELIDVTPKGALVWYASQSDITTIPLKTFKDDCVNWWEIQKVGSWPNWIQKGARVTISGNQSVLIAKIPPSKAPLAAKSPLADRAYEAVDQNVYLNISNAELEIRSVRYDYASALAIDSGILVILSMAVIEQGARLTRNFWTRIDDGDDYADDPHKALLAQFDDL